jgi:hypothetical protein
MTLVRTDVSEERIAAGIRVEITSELMTEAIRSSETSVITRTTWRHIPEDDILQYPALLLFFRAMECHVCSCHRILKASLRPRAFQIYLRLLSKMNKEPQQFKVISPNETSNNTTTILGHTSYFLGVESTG